QSRCRLRRDDPGADPAATGDLRARPERRTMIAITFHAFAGLDFWIGVGVLAATYGIFGLGLQLNVGTTGITNFGQAGFMAIGAYAMGILVVREGWSWWWAMLAAIGCAVAASVVVGLPSLRL